jgi:hypothetical protein
MFEKHFRRPEVQLERGSLWIWKSESSAVPILPVATQRHGSHANVRDKAKFPGSRLKGTSAGPPELSH